MNVQPLPAKSLSAQTSRRLLWLILLLAAFVRLYRLDQMSVSNSVGFQGLSAVAALRTLEGWDWALAGPLTEDVRSSAFLVSIAAIASMFYWHPYALVLPVITLNLISVGLLYRLSLKHFGTFTAVMVAAFYASSPWAVLYARLLLPVSCLTVFALLLVYVSFCWLEEYRPHQLGLAVFLGLLIPQIHFSGLCVLPWLVMILVRGRPHLRASPLLCGTLAGVVAWLPWIEFQQLTRWTEVKAWVAQILQTPSAHWNALLDALTHLLVMLHSSGFEEWLGGSLSDRPDQFPLWLVWFLTVCSVLLAVLLMGTLLRSDFPSGRPHIQMLKFWIVATLACAALLRPGNSLNSVLIAQPFALLLSALSLDHLQQRFPLRGRLIVISAVAVLTVGNLMALGSFLSVLDSDGNQPTGAYELSYAQRQVVLESIIADAESTTIQIVGPYSGWYPAYELLQSFTEPLTGAARQRSDVPRCYWIDEQPIPKELSAEVWLHRKERQVNPAVAAILQSPPDWVITRHWSIGVSQVYQLSFVQKQPLR